MANSWFEETIEKEVTLDVVSVSTPKRVNMSENEQGIFHESLYIEACKYYGLLETKGASHHKKILEFHQSTWLCATDDETPWCSSFMCHVVNSVVDRLNLGPEYKNDTPRAKEWGRWGRSIDMSSVEKGDIVILSRTGGGHVALATGAQGNGHIALLGGNQNNMVCISNYPANRVQEIRRIR